MPWPELSNALYHRHELLRLLARDAYCGGCQLARITSNWQSRVDQLTKTYLHCSACKCDHPACLFSVKQRETLPERRRCIGHEGYFKYCSHNRLWWKDVLGAPTAPDALCRWYFCRHEDHKNFECHPRSKWSRLTRRRETSCTCYNDSATSPIISLPPTRPIVSLAPAKDYISLHWTAHMPIDTTKRAGNNPITARSLRSSLADLRRHEAGYICPETQPGRLAELRCFDPNLCDCVKFEGVEHVDWPRTPAEELDLDQVAFTCRTADATAQCLHPQICDNKDHKGYTTRAHKAEYLAAQCKSPLDMRTDHRARTDDSKLGKKLSQETSGAQAVWMRPCHDNEKKCRVVLYMRRIATPLIRNNLTGTTIRSMSSQWYRALDPDSYNLTDDVDGMGVYWCGTPRCSNFYRYSLSRLLKPEDYRRDCGTGCPCTA